MSWLKIGERGAEELAALIEDNEALLELLGRLLKETPDGGVLKVGALRRLLNGVFSERAADELLKGVVDGTAVKAKGRAKLVGRLFPKLDTAALESLQLPLTTLAEADAASRRRVTFPLVDLQASKGGEAEKGHGKALVSLELEAPVAIPRGLRDAGGVVEEVVRIGATGALAGDRESGGELAHFTLALGGEGRAAFDLYYRCGWERPFHQGVGMALHALRSRSPMRLSDLETLFDGARLGGEGLAAVTFTTQQRWRFDGAVSLAPELSLGGGNPLLPRIQFTFQSGSEGRFRYRLAPHREGIEVALTRLDEERRKERESWRFDLDLSGIAAKLIPLFQGHLAEGEALLGRVLDVLPEPRALRNALVEAVSEPLSQIKHRDRLLTALTLQGGRQRGVQGENQGDQGIEQLLGERLAERIGREERLWSEKMERAVERAVKGSVDALELSPKMDAELRKALSKGTEKIAAKLTELLEQRILKLTEGGALGEMIDALEAVGERISGPIERGERRLEALVGPVRKVLGRYQRWLSQVQAHLESAASRKVALNFFSERERVVGEHFRLNFLIPRGRGGGYTARQQQLYARMLLGDAAALFDALGEREADAPLRTLGGSSLEAYRSLKREGGYACVLFGFDLQGGRLLDAETRVTVDPSGDLQVVSGLSYQRHWHFLAEHREYRFVDLFRLAGGASMGALGVALSLATREDRITPQEARAFFSGLEHFALVREGSGARASVLLDGVSPTAYHQARLDAGFAFAEAEVARLIGFGAPLKPDERSARRIRAGETGDAQGGRDDAPRLHDVALDPARVAAVKRHAAQAIGECCTADPIDPVMLRRLATYRRLMPELGGTLAEMILTVSERRREALTRRLGWAIDDGTYIVTDKDRREDMMWLAQRHGAVDRFATVVLPTLWAVAELGGGDGERGDDPQRIALELERCQRRVGEALGGWFDYSRQLGWSFNLNDTVRPLTLALFRSFAELADTAENRPGPYMEATLVLIDEHGEERRREVLTE